MNKQKPILVENETAVLPHRVLQPETAGLHPTVVMLHGRLGTEDVMWIFQQTLPEDWLIVAPRGNVQEENGRFSWHHPQQDEWPTVTAFATAVNDLTKFILTLPGLYNADLARLYLMGFSQGAAVSFATAIHQPELIKGIASLVGFMPRGAETAVETARLADLPVFMAAGTKDERIPLAIAQESAKAVRAAGAFLEYREYDTGHKLNGAGMSKLKQWWVERAND